MKAKFMSFFVPAMILLITPGFLYGQKDERADYKLLWRITGNGLKSPSYLFGTMHVRDERVFQFSDSVLVALNSCKAFSAEIDFDDYIVQILERSSKGKESNQLKNQLTDEEYQLVKNKLQKEAGIDLEKLSNQSQFLQKMLCSCLMPPKLNH